MTPTQPRPRDTPGVALGVLAARLGLTEIAEPLLGVRIGGVTHDSRQVQPGDLYAALLGERTHGAEFARQAAESGAVAILTDPLGRERSRLAGLPVLVVPDARAVLGQVSADVYGRPADALRCLGVTGTNGKTTTAFLMESGLRAAGHTTGLLGTVATRIGDESIPSARTTPEAPDLHALLAVMRERGATAVAMEVSSHALDMHRVDGVVFAAALFTNLSQDHLDFHFTLEAYFRAKCALFTPERAVVGVVNIDDAWGRRLVELARIPVQTYSTTGAAADWRATDVRESPNGSTFTVLGPDGARGEGSVSLPGTFNVANALGAIATLVAGGIPLPDALRGVGDCPGVPGRMERIVSGQPFLAVVDYAHTPDAIATLLAALRPVTTGRLIIVLGAGGDRDRGKRPVMGEVASRAADVLVLTDDNPRSEDPKEILSEVRRGAEAVFAEEAADLHIEHDRAAAIALAVRLARAGDTVVVAGKGHEQGQEAAGVVRPFDDRTVLREAIGAGAGVGGGA